MSALSDWYVGKGGIRRNLLLTMRRLTSCARCKSLHPRFNCRGTLNQEPLHKTFSPNKDGQHCLNCRRPKTRSTEQDPSPPLTTLSHPVTSTGLLSQHLAASSASCRLSLGTLQESHIWTLEERRLSLQKTLAKGRTKRRPRRRLGYSHGGISQLKLATSRRRRTRGRAKRQALKAVPPSATSRPRRTKSWTKQQGLNSAGRSGFRRPSQLRQNTELPCPSLPTS